MPGRLRALSWAGRSGGRRLQLISTLLRAALRQGPGGSRPRAGVGGSVPLGARAGRRSPYERLDARHSPVERLRTRVRRSQLGTLVLLHPSCPRAAPLSCCCRPCTFRCLPCRSNVPWWTGTLPAVTKPTGPLQHGRGCMGGRLLASSRRWTRSFPIMRREPAEAPSSLHPRLVARL